MPGDPVSLRASTEAASLVLVSVYDKSLELIAKACTSVEASNVSNKNTARVVKGIRIVC